jgi:peptidoglycan/xylan/chitin deacetylase (PgdA/CDA1 family)
MNRRLKKLAERAIAESGIPSLARGRHRADALVLAYHDVIPDGTVPTGDASLHITQADLGLQLDELTKTHEVVPLSAVIRDAGAQHRRPRAAITFDDAYAGALSLGMDALEARGLPATVFVAPGILGQQMWWDRLADARTGDVPPADRNRTLWEFAGRAGPGNVTAGSSPVARLPTSCRIATLNELEAAAKRPGIAFGSHTWSHPNLCAVPPEDLDGELAKPLSWLGERFMCTVPLVSYPYGLRSPTVELAAQRLGYEAGFRIDGGWLAWRTAQRYSLPRFNVPAGLSLDGFRLRSAGIGLH